MLQTLKTRLIECDHPVGIKKTSNWKLPPVDFAYGKKECPDKEGVSIITRSWQVHQPSQTAQPPQDFIKINKIAVQLNATSHSAHKDFRKTVDIRKKMPMGSNVRKYYLPPEDFTYGKRNRTPTPVKEVINYDYSRKAEEVIHMEYDAFMEEKRHVDKIVPKTTRHFTKLLESKKSSKLKEEKPLYKLKMFQDVGSKVTENLRQFKTYHPKKSNIDGLIEKVEGELKAYEES